MGQFRERAVDVPTAPAVPQGVEAPEELADHLGATTGAAGRWLVHASAGVEFQGLGHVLKVQSTMAHALRS